MKTYRHGKEGRERFMGYHTGDSISVIFLGTNKLTEETTHIHTMSDEIFVPVRGKGTIWVNGKIYRLQPGTIRVVERREPRRVLSVYKGPFELYVIQNAVDDKEEIETPQELSELMKKHRIS